MEMDTKSILKKPGTPILGKRPRGETIEELMIACEKESAQDKDAQSENMQVSDGLQVIGISAANMGQKRVKFN